MATPGAPSIARVRPPRSARHGRMRLLAQPTLVSIPSKRSPNCTEGSRKTFYRLEGDVQPLRDAIERQADLERLLR